MDCQSIPAYHDVSGERQIQPLIESLLSALKTEIDLQKELQCSLEEERRVLKRPDSNQLLQSNAKKETILLKAMMLDEVIADIVKKISQTVNIREQHITLSDLSAYATPPLQAELQNCRKLLASLVMNNRELNLEQPGLARYVAPPGEQFDAGHHESDVRRFRLYRLRSSGILPV